VIIDAAVRQDAAAIYRFVETVVRMCSDISEYPVYTNPTRKFLAYVKSLGEQTQRFLINFPSEVAKNSKTAFSKRKKLLELRNSWETIHEYLKPTLDADTLHLPTPLMLAFQDLVNKTKNLEPIEFTIFHATEVNYLQIPAGIFREVANGIADAINGDHFPLDQGFIGMPYSQANGFLLNSLLPHEMGHFVYQEIFEIDVEAEIDKVLEALEGDLGILDDQDIASCRDMLKRWVEEMFCDLFAICLIGPAYSFALIELTGALVLAGESSLNPVEFYFFIDDHPAEIARFDAHVLLLEKLNWWAEIKDINCPSIEVLRLATSRRSDIHIEGALPGNVDEPRMLACYYKVIDWLITYVPTQIPSDPLDIAEFKSQSDIISEYFRQAVVPSTIVIGNVRKNPRSVVLINSAFKFYLESLPDLLANVIGTQKDSVKDLGSFTERLELWALKAIEDIRLLEHQHK
jgi:hypothetical protein